MEGKSEKPAPGIEDAPETAGQGEAAPGGKAQDARPEGKGGPASVKNAEVGGPKGPDPTRYGDWERKGRCIDF